MDYYYLQAVLADFEGVYIHIYEVYRNVSVSKCTLYILR